VRTPWQILEDFTTIAVVGASRHEDKAAYAVPLQMKLHGWHVIPVNPSGVEIWGERCYPTLADVPEPVELVNVFRPSDPPTKRPKWSARRSRSVPRRCGCSSASCRRRAATLRSKPASTTSRISASRSNGHSGWPVGPPIRPAVLDRLGRSERRARQSLYSLSRPREMIVFWISEVPSPMSRNGASRMRRSISYSLENPYPP
jgi:uncharacterized protein